MIVRSATLLLLLAVPACAPQAEPPSPAAQAAVFAPPPRPHTVVVWATQSLQRPLERLARRYEQEASGSKVELFCAGGAELLRKRGAAGPCDVIAIGDSSLMSRFAAAAYLASSSPAELARNRIAIAVARGNPLGIRDFSGLAGAGVRVALGARSSSIGRYSRWALSNLSIDVKPVLEAETADAVLAAVQSEKADAGIVYLTTFADREGVERIDVPEASNQPVLYSISVDREAREPAGAAAFRHLALSPVGQGIFRECGFLPIGAK